jgi:hypothetical protein
MIDLPKLEEIRKLLKMRETVVVRAKLEWLEPEALIPQKMPGLELDNVTLDSQAGLHVVVGRNNSGKTRFLGVVSTAKLSRTIDARGLPRQVLDKIEKSLEGFIDLGQLSTMRVTWDRLIQSPKGDPHSPQFSRSVVGVEVLGPDGKALKVPPNKELANIANIVRGHVSDRLRFRPAVMVPTNRFIRDEGALNYGGGIATLDTFVPMLENLKREYSSERQYEDVASAFEDVTDGLRLEFRGTGGSSVLHVREGDAPPKRLNECGDGLRDLVVILSYLVIFREFDLMIDEPGLRLHPHAQRKLLGHLERASRTRALWIASHDGTLVASPAVKRHYSVRREAAQACSYVKELPTQAELRDAFYELGWTPQDALLADHVLYCEGPADKTVFDEVVHRLAEAEPAFGGTIVVELGGDGTVWGRNPQVLRSVEFLRRVAPHANHVIVLDKGDESASSISSLVSWLKPQGVKVRFLRRNELENYFLQARLVAELCSKAVGWPRDWYRGDVAALSLPTEGKAAALLGGKDLIAGKGSDILNEVFQSVFGKKYDKTLGARTVVPVWRTLAPDLATELIGEIKAALIDTREGGAI